MRFALLRENSDTNELIKQSFANRLIYIGYNIIWWLPILLPIIKVIDYRTGFIAFLIITIFRAIANLYRNNFLTTEQAEHFPLRAP